MSKEPVLQLENYIGRRWTQKDREYVLKIIEDASASYGIPFEPESEDVIDAVQVEEYYWKNDRGEFFVIDNVTKGEVVGSAGYYDVSAERGERSAEVRKMFLKPEVRGKGIGRNMLAVLEERMRCRGFRTVYIKTAGFRKRACRLYEAAGYTDAGSAHENDLLLKKNLN